LEKIFDEKVEIEIEGTQVFLTAKMQKCRSCSLTAFEEILRDCQMNVFSSPNAVVLNLFNAATPFSSKFLFATHNIVYTKTK
jgi:hypothetical protein